MCSQERFKFYAVAYLVLLKDGNVLLQRRFNTGYEDGIYDVVAGHLEAKETTKQCIVREAKEEAGVTLDPNDIKVAHVVHRFQPVPEREYFDTYLVAEKWSGDVINMEPDKCDELKWFSLDSLPENIMPKLKLALNNIQNNIPFGEFGW